MKQINTYINEKLRLSVKPQYTCQPKDWIELQQIIIDRIKDEGPECDLNDIDTSKIKDMSNLFNAASFTIFKKFNGDVSQWDVSNVTNMFGMFYECKKFNCDISRWNVSKVSDTDGMFYDCKNFNCDLSKWDMSNVKDIRWMFEGCKKFNQDLDSWNVSNVKYMTSAFKNCPTTPTWYDRKQYDK